MTLLQNQSEKHNNTKPADYMSFECYVIDNDMISIHYIKLTVFSRPYFVLSR